MRVDVGVDDAAAHTSGSISCSLFVRSARRFRPWPAVRARRKNEDAGVATATTTGTTNSAPLRISSPLSESPLRYDESLKATPISPCRLSYAEKLVRLPFRFKNIYSTWRCERTTGWSSILPRSIDDRLCDIGTMEYRCSSTRCEDDSLENEKDTGFAVRICPDIHLSRKLYPFMSLSSAGDHVLCEWLRKAARPWHHQSVSYIMGEQSSQSCGYRVGDIGQLISADLNLNSGIEFRRDDFLSLLHSLDDEANVITHLRYIYMNRYDHTYLGNTASRSDL